MKERQRRRVFQPCWEWSTLTSCQEKRRCFKRILGGGAGGGVGVDLVSRISLCIGRLRDVEAFYQMAHLRVSQGQQSPPEPGTNLRPLCNQGGEELLDVLLPAQGLLVVQGLRMQSCNKTKFPIKYAITELLKVARYLLSPLCYLATLAAERRS